MKSPGGTAETPIPENEGNEVHSTPNPSINLVGIQHIIVVSKQEET